MKFKEAYDLIKKGFYIKLPSWGGYWSWDDDKETIMMHLKDNTTIMDIRATTAVDYTLRNILSDEWIIATNENTPILGGENTFDFYKALEYMKKGYNVRRNIWNNKKTYITISVAKTYIDAYKEKLNKRVPGYFSDRLSKMDKVIVYGNDNLSDEFKIVALTQEDILANDWCFYNEEVSNDQNNNK